MSAGHMQHLLPVSCALLCASRRAPRKMHHRSGWAVWCSARHGDASARQNVMGGGGVPSFASGCSPSCKLARVAAGRSLLSPVGPTAPPQDPLASPCPFRCRSVRARAGCALRGGEASPWDPRLPAAPGSGTVIAIPAMCGVVLSPRLLALRECGRIPLLRVFLPPSFNFKRFPTLSEASSKI